MEVVSVALNAPNIWEERDRYTAEEDEEEYNMCQALREWIEDEHITGQAEGAKLKLIEQICKKLGKGKTVKTIAEELEEDISVIQKIYDAATACAPEYDNKKIYESLYGELKKSTW